MTFSGGTVQLLAVVLPTITPEQPPKTEGLLTLLNWAAWFAIISGLAGFLGSLSFLAFAAWTGREISHVKGLVISIIVCILAVGVGGIFQLFV